MDRKDFLKNVCKYGACGCAGMMLASPVNLFANATAQQEKQEDWRIGFMQKRISKLIENMNGKLDAETLVRLLENMGRTCAQESKGDYLKYKGDLKGYLNSLGNWVEKAEHNEEKREVKLIGKKSTKCFCPFVDVSKMPKEFCNCTKGWNKEVFETITGRPIDIKIDTTILWGGERCAFTITYK
jgi:predicted ArsR family transcriptional regulator